MDENVYEAETWIIPAVKPQTQAQAAGGYLSNLRKVIKSSGVYALASMASPLVSLVLAPFLTHHLSHADYGALAVLSTAIALVAGITQMGLGSAFFRAYNYDYEERVDQLGVVSTVTLLIALVAIPTAIVIAFVPSWLSLFLLGTSDYATPVRVAGCVVLIQNLVIPAAAWLRAENRAVPYTTLAIGNMLINLVMTIVLVGPLRMGITGSLIGTGLGYGFVVVCMLPQILLRAGLRLRVDMLKGLLTFGLPNVATFVSVWILQLSDRYLLTHLASLVQTASYSVAYSLGGAINIVIIAPFTLAWPTAQYSIAKRPDAARIFQTIFRWYSLLLLAATYALSLAAILLLDIFFPPAYRSATPIIPIIAASIMFNGIFGFFTIGVGIRRKTWLAFIFTSIAYIALALIGYVVMQRIYPVPFEVSMLAIALIAGVAFYIGGSALASTQQSLLGWAISIAALSLYTIFLILLGLIFTWRHKRKPQPPQEVPAS
jgi:O-antigen/teichoic acid export membrane protein